MQAQTDIAALVLRTALGVILIAHGLLKVLVYTLPGTVQFFDSVGFPGWMAYPVAGLEIVGGALMIAGLWVRPLSIAMLPIMLGAMAVHFPFGWVFSNPNGGWEFPAFLAVAFVAQALLGPGRIALRLPQRRRAVAA